MMYIPYVRSYMRFKTQLTYENSVNGFAASELGAVKKAGY